MAFCFVDSGSGIGMKPGSRAILFSILFSAIYLAICLYSYIQHMKRRKPATPVHLKPNSAAVKREARKAEHRKREP